MLALCRVVTFQCFIDPRDRATNGNLGGADIAAKLEGICCILLIWDIDKPDLLRLCFSLCLCSPMPPDSLSSSFFSISSLYLSASQVDANFGCHELNAGCCFLICPSREEADKAVNAYHNKHTLPGVRDRWNILQC
jgi:hypothetical protein